MIRRIWLMQIPTILLFTAAFAVVESGVQGELHVPVLREQVFPKLRTVTGLLTNLKFHARGPAPPKNKIVIIEVDSDSLSQYGRWPWHRDLTALLVQKAFDAGAKVVGLDIVFSEEDRRVSPELAEFLTANKLGASAGKFETDLVLAEVVRMNREKLVLGWTTELFCAPAYGQECQLDDAELKKIFPQVFPRFAYDRLETTPPDIFDQLATPLFATPYILSNIPIFDEAAKHAGFFNSWPDNDGFIRRTNLVITAQGKAYPSLALAMARIGLAETLELKLDRKGLIEKLGFGRSGRQLPVSPLGAMEINFRGPSYHFPYIRAAELLQNDDDTIRVERDRKIASDSRSSMLKDAYVLIGVSALGSFDMRAFPFDSNTPGVEGHANILDNLLSGDALVRGAAMGGSIWIFLIMTLGALLFAYYTERLESVPALLLFIAVMGGLSFTDFKLLFGSGINADTAFLYLELLAISGFTLAAKYVMEERNKKFIRGAFSKYVAPAIVDSILKDPSKLSVGGDKKELTILFSDIRGFTTFSEKMDAKKLAQFLNDYLSIMTDIVFECEGTLDKYIGDAVMAFWGAPLDQPRHAANACKAAALMMQALAKHKPRFKEQYDVDVNVGVGLNTGVVNVGNMGSERIFEYTVIGDHVNLASRLEGLTKYYGVGIVTSRFTFDAITAAGHEIPSHRSLDLVKVKGKNKAVELIQVLEREVSAEGLALYRTARDHYTARRWDEALDAFRKSAELLASNGAPDGPSVLFMERCQDFKKTPPVVDWDGSWEMHSK